MENTVLSERSKRFLNLIMDYYIKTGNPVGSSSLVENYNLSWSSATVRNTMAELTNRGYLRKPHVSAGRVPTEKGIRLYIKSLPSPSRLSQRKKSLIKKRYRQIDGTIDELMSETSSMLSDISRLTGLATLPSTRFMEIKSAELVLLGDNKLLIVFVFDGGMTEKTVMRVEKEISAKTLHSMSDYLNKILVGLTLDEIKSVVIPKLRRQRRLFDDFFEGVLSTKLFDSGLNSDVFIRGQTRVLEHSDAEGVKELFKAFEEKNFLLSILDKVIEGNVTRVFVGQESGVLDGYSLIAAPYGSGKRLGTLGVLGPARMDYSRLIPLVDYTAKIVSSIFDEGAK